MDNPTARNEKSEAYIDELKTAMAKLEEQLSIAEENGKEQAKLLVQQRNQLEMNISIANQRRAIDQTIKASIAQSDIYNKVQQMAMSSLMLSKTDWQDVERMIIELIPGFKNSIYSITKISQQDYRLCLLIRMGGLSGKEMAVLLGRTDSAISKAKKKLQEKFLGENKENKSLEDFLLSL